MTVRFEDGPGADNVSVFNAAGTHIGSLRKTDKWRYHSARVELEFTELLYIAQHLALLNNPNRMEEIKVRRDDPAGTEEDPHTISNDLC